MTGVKARNFPCHTAFRRDAMRFILCYSIVGI